MGIHQYFGGMFIKTLVKYLMGIKQKKMLDQCFGKKTQDIFSVCLPCPPLIEGLGRTLAGTLFSFPSGMFFSWHANYMSKQHRSLGSRFTISWWNEQWKPFESHLIPWLGQLARQDQLLCSDTHRDDAFPWDTAWCMLCKVPMAEAGAVRTGKAAWKIVVLLIWLYSVIGKFSIKSKRESRATAL